MFKDCIFLCAKNNQLFLCVVLYNFIYYKLYNIVVVYSAYMVHDSNDKIINFNIRKLNTIRIGKYYFKI